MTTRRLRRRLLAIKEALESLPRQAHWRVRGVMAREAKVFNPGRSSLMHLAFAPGFHPTGQRVIDVVLGDCHYFAPEAWHWSDTS